MTYLQAIDDTVDVFADLDRGKAVLVATLCNRAKADVFRGVATYSDLRVDPMPVITAAREGSVMPVRETPAYKELNKVINDMAMAEFNGKKS